LKDSYMIVERLL